MTAEHGGINELLASLTVNLKALKACGLEGFECSADTIKKLDNLSRTLDLMQSQSRAANDVAVPAPAKPTPAQSQTVLAAPTETLDDIKRDLGDCKRCGLCTQRRNIVFGAGNPHAKLVFVGEGPGQDEDLQGIPFVGAAGQLLTKIIAAMKLSRDDVYICNVVKCRPPGNRNPAEDEIKACIPFLERQIAAINPMFIVGLGGVAVQTLLNTSTGISRLRGKWTTYNGIKFMPTFHPSYLLRSPEKKREVWQDVQQVMALYPY